MKRKILIADDNTDAADMLTWLLEAMGHEVTTAYDGESAVALAEEKRPQVVLLDIGMPKLNGFEAAEAIRAQPWGKPMLLVALTGWGQEEDRSRSSAAGFDVHLVKPVEQEDLKKVLAMTSDS